MKQEHRIEVGALSIDLIFKWEFKIIFIGLIYNSNVVVVVISVPAVSRRI